LGHNENAQVALLAAAQSSTDAIAYVGAVLDNLSVAKGLTQQASTDGLVEIKQQLGKAEREAGMLLNTVRVAAQSLGLAAGRAITGGHSWSAPRTTPTSSSRRSR
jgi:hypothetical protein